MNWPPLLVVSVSQERNLIITITSAHTALDWRCLIGTRHFYWERRSWSKQHNRICFARENNNNKKRMRCESSCNSCHDWCFNFARERPAPEARRRNLWCLSGPAEKLSRWQRPSARGSTYDWQNCRSFLSILAQCVLALINLLVIAFQPDGGWYLSKNAQWIMETKSRL